MGQPGYPSTLGLCQECDQLKLGCAVIVPWCLGSGRFGGFGLEPAVTQPIERDAIYRRRRFPRRVIETCVRWYLTYRLSYRDLVALMAQRDVHVTHR
jgi:hypothetical protein